MVIFNISGFVLTTYKLKFSLLIGGIVMPLKNRMSLGTTLDSRLMILFKELAKKTRIPISRLTDEAIEDLLIKHGMIEESERKES